VRAASLDFRATDGKPVVDRAVVDDALAKSDADEPERKRSFAAGRDGQREAACKKCASDCERCAAAMPERRPPEDEHRREPRDMPDRAERRLQRGVGAEAPEEIRENRCKRADHEVAHRMQDA